MSQYKPYPAYKDSGVEWLGKVPEHWISKKLMYWIESGYGSGTTPSDEIDYTSDKLGVSWVTTGELRENVIKRTEKCVRRESLVKYSALKIHPAGSLIIAMYGATIGRTGILGVKAVLNQACFAIHPNPYFKISLFKYWFEGFRNELIELGTGGGQPNVSSEKIRNLKFAMPSLLEEQTTIVTYLDRETTRIDALITKKTRFIELLREKRQALITHAVTKGLDPNVKMKDSGVEWLGEVPEHWVIKRIKFLATLNPSVRKDLHAQGELEVSFLPMEDIGEDGSLLLERTRRIEDVKSGYSYFEDGDVAFAKVTPCFENGKGALMRGLIKGVGFGTTELTVLRPTSLVTSEFLN